MRRKIAIYGKGGIGKSTISSNLSAALSHRGMRVLQMGCDPKHDSTRLLTGDKTCITVLDYLRDVGPDKRRLEDIVISGYGNIFCVEAGGPEPGIGCAGRGIISAFDLLSDLGVDSLDFDLTLYDVLGDVVCGGFAVPIRNEYADTVYIVTSGEFMSIYAANNILRGVANYNPDRIGGIIFNSRGDDFEDARVEKFASAVKIPIVAKIKRSRMFSEAERECKTVVEMDCDSEISGIFFNLADTVIEGKKYTSNFLSEDVLEKTILGREKPVVSEKETEDTLVVRERPTLYSSRSVRNKEILHGCAFSGASTVTLSISGLTTVFHSSKNCAQFASQLAGNGTKRAYLRGGYSSDGFISPDVKCTCMDEASMIFGGTDRLRKVLEDSIAHGKKDIAVITACPAGIIGDDSSGVIDEIRAKNADVNIMLIEEDGNLKGDHMQGLIDACTVISKGLILRNDTKSETVNLVGIKPLATNAFDNEKTISNLLSKLGIGINCNFIGNCSVSDIKRMTEAKISLLITYDQFARTQKEFLMNEYSIPFTKEPIGTGLISTRIWMDEIGKVFDKQEEVESVLDSIEKEYLKRTDSMKKQLAGKRAYITSMHMNIDWLIDMAEDLEIGIIRSVVLERPDHTHDIDMKTRHRNIEKMNTFDIDTIKEDILEKQPDFIFTTYLFDQMPDSMLQFKIPLVPDLGPFGGLDLMERWIRLSKKPKTEGWKKDVL